MKLPTSRSVSAVLSLMSAALLVACGGGGGGDSSGPTNTSAITSSNAQTVSAQALNGSTAVNGGATTGSSLVTGVSVTGETTARTGLVSAALQQIYRGLDARTSNLVTGITTSETVNCPVSGTMTVGGTFASSTDLTNGDVLSITATNCVGSSGEKLNGGFSVKFSNLSGTIGGSYTWSATLGFTFTNFTLEENGEISGSNGDMTLGYSQTNSSNSVSEINGSSLRSTLVKSSVTVVDETIKSYSIKDTQASTLYTETANFTFTDNQAATYSAYTITTLAPFKRTGSTSYPYEGSVRITAGNGSKATVTALSSTNVRIDVDSNGDGTTDQTINTTWAALDSLI
jgi:hypothetical protein